MKLLVVTNDFPPRVGGIEDYVANLLRHLPTDTRAVVLGPPHPEAAAYDARFPHRVIRWPRSPMLPTPALIRAVVDLARHESPDVIVFGAAVPLALMAGSVAARTLTPIVTFTHGVEPAAALVPGGSALLRRIARHVRLMTVVSTWAERRLREAVGAAVPMAALPSGVDELRFHVAVSGAAIRARHGIGHQPLIVGVSRLVPRKGHDMTIRALPLIRRQLPDARVLLVGGGPDRARLERLVDRYRVRDAVTFAGAVSDALLPQYFAAADVFAMPNRARCRGLDDEALGAVFLQAAAVGRPAVAGRAGGAPEAVRHGETGLVVDGRDHTALAAGLVQLLDDRGYGARLGAAAAARVHAALTWRHMAARLHQHLAALATSSGR